MFSDTAVSSSTSPPFQRNLCSTKEEIFNNTTISSTINNTNTEEFENIDSDSSGEFDGDEDGENKEITTEGGRKAKKKRFEAFVMTGDRMINLAKTPGNNDFRSKYYKPSIDPIPLLEDGTASVPSSPAAVLDVRTMEEDPNHYGVANENGSAALPLTTRQITRESASEYMDPSGSDINVRLRTDRPQRNRSSVR